MALRRHGSGSEVPCSSGSAGPSDRLRRVGEGDGLRRHARLPGDYLKTSFAGSRITAAEALQCPTLLRTGFGVSPDRGHRRQARSVDPQRTQHGRRGGDRRRSHDAAAAPVQRAEPDGRRSWLAVCRQSDVQDLPLLGISSIGNLIAAIKTARWFELDETRCPGHVVHRLGGPVRHAARGARGVEPGVTTTPSRPRVDFERRLLGVTTDHMRELTYPDRKAMHNLKYFTWVEQQGRTVEELDALWNPSFWEDLAGPDPEEWDEAIEASSTRTPESWMPCGSRTGAGPRTDEARVTGRLTE